jgi:hypothetical protein
MEFNRPQPLHRSRSKLPGFRAGWRTPKSPNLKDCFHCQLLAGSVPAVCQMKRPRRSKTLQGLGITGAVGRNRTGDLLITKRANSLIDNNLQLPSVDAAREFSQQLVLDCCALLQLFGPQCAASVPRMPCHQRRLSPTSDSPVPLSHGACTRNSKPRAFATPCLAEPRHHAVKLRHGSIPPATAVPSNPPRFATAQASRKPGSPACSLQGLPSGVSEPPPPLHPVFIVS